MRAWRRTAASICALTMLITAGCSDDDDATPDVTSPTTEPTSDAYPMSSSVWVGSSGVEPPPGGLVDSVANFGWTPGEFSVSDDGAAGTPYRCGHRLAAARSRRSWRLSYNSGAGNGMLGVGWSLAWAVRDLMVRAHDRAGRLHGRRAFRRVGRALPRRQPAGPGVAAILTADRVSHRGRDLRADHRLQHARQRARLLRDVREERNDPHLRPRRRIARRSPTC